MKNSSTQFNLTRRNFLKGAGVFSVSAAAAALVGCSPQGQNVADSADASISSDDESIASAENVKDVWSIDELGEPTETIQAEVCIVGGGGTGIAAAVQAMDLGLKPLIIEKEMGLGGSFQGTEGMTALESKYTRDDPPYLDTAYYPDQPYGIKNCMMTCLNYHHWIPSYEMYKNWFTRTSDTIDWLEGHGQEFGEVTRTGTGPKIWHVYKHEPGEAPGYAFISKLAQTAQDMGAEVRTETIARHLVMGDGKVEGVLCETKDGVLKVEAPVVLICTGGYANNPDMVAELAGAKNEKLFVLGMPGREGDGLKMAKEAGAAFAEGIGTIEWGGPVCDGAISATWTIDAFTASVQPTLWLNQDGKRFCREDLWQDDFPGAGVLVRRQRKSYALFTEADVKDWEENGPWYTVYTFGIPGTPMKDVREQLTASPGCHVGDDLAALCEEVGLDAEAVQETVNHYNEECAKAADADPDSTDADEDYGKHAQFMHPVEEGPYWLLETAASIFCTVGGIEVNEKNQVLDTEGKVIGGLYAGGCDAGGLFGDSYDVKFAPGSTASWAMNSGRFAMEDAAEYLGK